MNNPIVNNISICWECGNIAEFEHHVIPRSLGGTKTLPLCAGCHGKIHDRSFTGIGMLTKQGLAAKKARGERYNKSIPFGYSLGENNKIIPNDNELKVIELIISLKNSGISYRKIITELEARGIQPKQSNKWQAMSVRNIFLKNNK